jgi:hypothetical protein
MQMGACSIGANATTARLARVCGFGAAARKTTCFLNKLAIVGKGMIGWLSACLHIKLASSRAS